MPFRMSTPIKHILVIRLSAMGDVAMCIPILRRFTATYPEVQLTVLTRSFFAPFFKDIPNVKVFSPDLKGKHKGFLGIQKLSKELHRLNIDAVADLHNVLRSNILVQLLRLKGVPFKQIDKGRSEKKALTRAYNKVFKPLKTTHERYADVFKALGYPLDISIKNIVPIQKPLPTKIASYIGETEKKRIGIAPFAAHEGKMYPLTHMQKVIQELSKTYKIILFGGGKHEKECLGEIANKCTDVISVAGKFSLEEELVLISNLDLMLSMDSGNGHLAAMFGVKVITIWGATHPYAGFKPYGQPDSYDVLPNREKFPLLPTSIYGNKKVKGYEHVMHSIAPEIIIETIKKELN